MSSKSERLEVTQSGCQFWKVKRKKEDLKKGPWLKQGFPQQAFEKKGWGKLLQLYSSQCRRQKKRFALQSETRDKENSTGTE